jgi:hypothetical protein
LGSVGVFPVSGFWNWNRTEPKIFTKNLIGLIGFFSVRFFWLFFFQFSRFIQFLGFFAHPYKILINLSLVLKIPTYSYGALLGRKQYSVLMFKVNFLGLGLLLLLLFLFFNIYIYIYTHNASLTHVTSFRLMTPRPVGLRALGVETPLRA